MFNLLHLHDLLLLQDLDSVVSLIVLGLDEMDSTKRAGTEGPFDLEVGQGIFALGLSGLSLAVDGTSSGVSEVCGHVSLVSVAVGGSLRGGIGSVGHRSLVFGSSGRGRSSFRGGGSTGLLVLDWLVVAVFVLLGLLRLAPSEQLAKGRHGGQVVSMLRDGLFRIWCTDGM